MMEDIRLENYSITDKRTGEVYDLPEFIKSLFISREESPMLDKVNNTEDYQRWVNFYGSDDGWLI